MRNSIVEDYLHLLKISKFASSKQKQLAAELITQLPRVKSTGEVQALFSRYSKLASEEDSFSFNLFCCFFSPLEELSPLRQQRSRIRNLSEMLEEWNTLLTQQEVLKHTVWRKLIGLPPQNKSEPLVRLICEMINTPDSSMNGRMRSLLIHANADNLESALATLAKLPPSTPKNLRKGDFGSPSPSRKNSDHTACLGLLANNSAAYARDTPDWILANNLLQVALQMYDDLHHEELKTMDSKPFIEEEGQSTPCCSLS
ncbi:hypothetical protein [Legionella micdadei]|uniref:hypothetical protein n=1 Tax=Legionella micdadei TaxID=451 RepID=UPI0009EF7205|nr:hypothetical protein [Legionella micdadei]ARH01159.1 hypothetical protein B6V88_12500 [Legionella micdadei]